LAAPLAGAAVRRREQAAVVWHDLDRWSRTLDSSLRVPGTTLRVGWDGVLGLVPVVGDAAGLVLSLVVLAKGMTLGVRRWTLARLVSVAVADALVGLVPVVGMLGDLAFKANERNLRTLRRHAADPPAVEKESRRFVITTVAVVLAVVVAATALVVAGAGLAVRWLW
jgi:hypothetical protein